MVLWSYGLHQQLLLQCIEDKILIVKNVIQKKIYKIKMGKEKLKRQYPLGENSDIHKNKKDIVRLFQI